jgi:hypothetical protein
MENIVSGGSKVEGNGDEVSSQRLNNSHLQL